MSHAPHTLAALRQRLDALDAQILALIAERQEISGEVAQVKQATGIATHEYARVGPEFSHAVSTGDEAACEG
jgi:chorismate mutase / prephenate dehydrogenase